MHPLRAGLAHAFLPALVALLIVAGCDATVPQGSGTAPPSNAGPTSGSSSGATLLPGATAPDALPSAATARPSPTSPTRSIAPSPVASGSAAPGSAAPGEPLACSGNDNNRAFFSDTAAAVGWDVYCPVLPPAWFVDTGSFRAASGGTMTIAYKTTGGLRLELREGAICSGSATECAPLDSSIGPGAFGDRTGVVGMRSGNLVLYVDPGESVSWQATGIGLDEASFRAFCEAMTRVPG